MHLTDGKLSRIPRGGDEQLIRWEQIYRMKSTAHRLHIRWIDAAAEPWEADRVRKDDDESAPGQFDHCGTIYIEEAESQELILLWRKHRGWGKSEKSERPAELSALRHIRADVISKDRAQFSSSFRSIRKLCLATLMIGLSLMAGGIVYLAWQLVEQYPSYSWPTVEGKVVAQQLRTFVVHRRRHTDQEAELSLSYEYTVAGQNYHADQYSLWAQKYRDGEQTVRAFANEHQQGMPIKVHYDPKDPAIAVLMPGADWPTSSTYLIFGSFLAFFGWIVRKSTARASWA